MKKLPIEPEVPTKLFFPQFKALPYRPKTLSPTLAHFHSLDQAHTLPRHLDSKRKLEKILGEPSFYVIRNKCQVRNDGQGMAGGKVRNWGQELHGCQDSKKSEILELSRESFARRYGNNAWEFIERNRAPEDRLKFRKDKGVERKEVKLELDDGETGGSPIKDVNKTVGVSDSFAESKLFGPTELFGNLNNTQSQSFFAQNNLNTNLPFQNSNAMSRRPTFNFTNHPILSPPTPTIKKPDKKDSNLLLSSSFLGTRSTPYVTALKNTIEGRTRKIHQSHNTSRLTRYHSPPLAAEGHHTPLN